MNVRWVHRLHSHKTKLENGEIFKYNIHGCDYTNTRSALAVGAPYQLCSLRALGKADLDIASQQRKSPASLCILQIKLC